MAFKTKKVGASRNAVQKPREIVNWQQRFKKGLTVLVFITVLGGGVYLHQEETLPVLHVTVEGELQHTDKSELIERVRPYVTGSFINVDVAGLRRAGESLAWVQQIQVRRIWPDTLHLVVEEHQAFARWNEQDLVNNRGHVFSPSPDTLPSGLVHLYGPDGSSELMARRLVSIQRQVNELNLRVRSLTMDERRSWQVEFSDDLQLRLGRADSEARLHRFIFVFSGALSTYREQIMTIDMRYTNGLAVQWKSGEQPDFNGTV